MKKITFLFAFFLMFSEGWSQTVSGYSFSQSAEAYVSDALLNSTVINDDGIQNALPIGFNFNFGGDAYTAFSISANGWIRLGSDIGGSSWINTLANTNANNVPLIAPFWDDHNPAPGAIKYGTTGVSPNRVLSVEWNNVSISTGGAVNAAATGSFKLRLFETSSVIEFVYGSMMAGPQLSASIGLNQVGSYLSVTPNQTATTSSITANNNINSVAFLTGKYTFTPAAACSGTPSPGATQATSNAVCVNDIIQLSLANNSNEVGLSYQWQSSTNNTDYTNIDSGFSPTLQITQSVNTYYRCVVSCGVNSATSTPLLITTNPISNCYCIPIYTVGKTDGDLISNVVIAQTSLANNTGVAAVNPSYTFFSGQPNYTATLQSGFTYTMNVTVGTYQQQNVSVWIDYNDDAIFSEEERVGSSGVIGANGTGIFSIALACDAPAGEHRMRVRDVWNTDASTLSPCDEYGYGEVEDYNITIQSASTCQSPQNVAVVNSSTLSVELNWESGCGQQSWDVYVVLAGSPAPTDSTVPTVSNLNTNGAVINELTPGTNYDFYVRGFCGANGFSPWSAIPVTAATLPLAVSNDECASAIALIPGANFEQNAVVATNVGATKTLGAPNPTCGIFGFGGDVWFSVVVPADGNVTIEVQSNPGSPLVDTAMTAFSGNCNELITLGCSDDEGVGAFSRLNLTGLLPGETIYARVWEYANDTFGTFQVSAWNPTLLKAEQFDTAAFSYNPNPVKDILNISYKNTISQVSVFNLLGQQVLDRELNANEVQLDLSRLSNGAYFIKVVSENQTKTIKIIKE